MSTAEHIQEIPLYWGINNRLGDGLSERVETATSLVIDRVKWVFSLRMEWWLIEEISLGEDVKQEVLQEVDNLLSFWKLNQYLWRKHHFAFPTKWQRVVEGGIEVDHKTSNLAKRVWRWASLFFDPGLNIWEKYLNREYDVSSPGMNEEEALERFLSQLYTFRRFLDWKKWYKPIEFVLFKLRKNKNKNSLTEAEENISHQYDVDDSFFEDLMRCETQDPNQKWPMQYTCGIDGESYLEAHSEMREYLDWMRTDNTLSALDENKMRLHCEKMWLRPWMKVLDAGCGWWWFAEFASKEFGVEVVWVTLSEEQQKTAAERNKGNDKVQIVLSDIREFEWKGEFDRVVSVWAFEHFRGFYDEFFQKANECLKEGGVMSLHHIGTQKQWEVAEFMSKYIFPGGYLPTKQETLDAADPYFKLQENGIYPNFENLREHYARTLDFWIKNLVKNQEKITDTYGEKFYRTNLFYLVASKVTFRQGFSDLYQFVFEKK